LSFVEVVQRSQCPHAVRVDAEGLVVVLLGQIIHIHHRIEFGQYDIIILVIREGFNQHAGFGHRSVKLLCVEQKLHLMAGEQFDDTETVFGGFEHLQSLLGLAQLVIQQSFQPIIVRIVRIHPDELVI